MELSSNALHAFVMRGSYGCGLLIKLLPHIAEILPIAFSCGALAGGDGSASFFGELDALLVPGQALRTVLRLGDGLVESCPHVKMRGW